MESIGSTSLLGVRKNTAGLWLTVQAPTASMTLDTTAGTYAPGCEIFNVGDGTHWINSGTTAVPVWSDIRAGIAQTVLPSVAATGPSCTINDFATVISVTNTVAGTTGGNIILPTPSVGKVLKIIVGATAAQLMAQTPSTTNINGGATAAASFAILGAASIHTLTCRSATGWSGSSQSATGTTTTLPASV